MTDLKIRVVYRDEHNRPDVLERLMTLEEDEHPVEVIQAGAADLANTGHILMPSGKNKFSLIPVESINFVDFEILEGTDG